MLPAQPAIPKPFLVKKLFSISGVWLVLFLIQHLLTNSQAAIWIGEDGMGFIRSVNKIHELPFLPLIEIVLLGVPIAIHGYWGILYARRAAFNSFPRSGEQPSLTHYRENHRFTWQRITSWILLFGIVAHVIHMRFWEAPTSGQLGATPWYMVSVQLDPGLYTLSERLDFQLFTPEQIAALQQKEAPAIATQLSEGERLIAQQRREQEQQFQEALASFSLQPDEGVAVSSNFGLADLLMVREAFKSYWIIILYTLFVIAATFHAFNGLWTAMISWGVTLTQRSQNLMRILSNVLFLGVLFLGLAAIWGTYWINLHS